MKNIIRYTIITSLFILSLIVTDKLVYMLKFKDPIMVSIMENNDKIMSLYPVINDDEMIPGISDCVINIDKSYKNMKKINEYKEELLEYDNVLNSINMNNSFDKYIIGGSGYRRNVSIVIYIKSNVSIFDSINFNANVFLDSNLLSTDILEVPDNIKVYNGGNSLYYDKVVIEWMNELINDTYNKSSYCINLDKNESNLDICSKNHMHSIKPVKYNNIIDIKSNINSGSIVYFDETNISYLNSVVNYINSKGFDIVFLDELFNENEC